MLSLGHRQCPLHSGGRTVSLRTAPHRGYEARGAWRGSPGVSPPPLAGGANRHFRLLRLIPCFAYFWGTPQLLKVLCLRAACASLPGGPAPPRPRWSRLSGRQDRAGTFDPARGARHRAPGAPARPLPPPPPRTCAERPRLPSADKVGRPGLRATGLGRRAATGTVLCTATCSAGSPAGGDTCPGSAAGENRVEPSTGRGTPRGAAIPQRTRFPSGRPLLHQKTPFLLKDRPSSPRE